MNGMFYFLISPFPKENGSLPYGFTVNINPLQLCFPFVMFTEVAPEMMRL
ncbi:hypothetical protein ACMA44_02885 [Chryseobacterium sp. S90]